MVSKGQQLSPPSKLHLTPRTLVSRLQLLSFLSAVWGIIDTCRDLSPVNKSESFSFSRHQRNQRIALSTQTCVTSQAFIYPAPRNRLSRPASFSIPFLDMAATTTLPSFVELMASLGLDPAQERSPSSSPSSSPRVPSVTPPSPSKSRSNPSLRDAAASRNRLARYSPYSPVIYPLCPLAPISFRPSSSLSAGGVFLRCHRRLPTMSAPLYACVSNSNPNIKTELYSGIFNFATPAFVSPCPQTAWQQSYCECLWLQYQPGRQHSHLELRPPQNSRRVSNIPIVPSRASGLLSVGISHAFQHTHSPTSLPAVRKFRFVPTHSQLGH